MLLRRHMDRLGAVKAPSVRENIKDEKPAVKEPKKEATKKEAPKKEATKKNGGKKSEK